MSEINYKSSNKIELENNIFYAEDNSPLRINSHTFNNGEGIIIINGNVTKLGYGCFFNISSLTEITINGILELGDYCFCKCHNLSKINNTSKLVSIGHMAFDGCYNLSAINVSVDIKSIGVNAFRNCYLMNFDWLENCNKLKEINEGTFANCKNILSLTIPDSVECIHKKAFYKCENMTSITLGKSLKRMGDNEFDAWQFEGCDNLKEINTKSEVTPEIYTTPHFNNVIQDLPNDGEIKILTYECDYNQWMDGEFGLRKKGWLCNKPFAKIKYTTTDGKIINTSVQFEGNLISNTYENGIGVMEFDCNINKIPDMAFYKKNTLKTIIFTKCVKTIGYGCFAECKNLTTVQMDGVENLSDGTFVNCFSITEFSAPLNIRYIPNAFMLGCKNLKTINLNNVTKIDNLAFGDCTSLTSFICNDSLSEIGDEVFSNCCNLVNVTFNNSLRKLGNGNFKNCGKLSVINTKNVVEMGDSQFINCSSLSNIIMDNSLHTIGAYSFKGCTSLANITIPNNLHKINAGLFEDCTKLETVNNSLVINEMNYKAFKGCTILNTVDVDNVTKFGDYAFCDCMSAFTTFVVPENITEIPEGLFCLPVINNALTSVTLNNKLVKIGAYAFKGSNIKNSVNIPDTVNEIGKSAFGECYYIPSFTGKYSYSYSYLDHRYLISGGTYDVNGILLDGGILIATATYGVGAFKIPEGVTDIEFNAMNQRGGIISVEFPETLKTIESYAIYQLYNCSKLYIPDSNEITSAIYSMLIINSGEPGIVYYNKNRNKEYYKNSCWARMDGGNFYNNWNWLPKE